MAKHNIYLIGFSGSGKSETGKKLSKMLNMPLIEMDQQIEENEGTKIDEIFNTKGEKYFRTLESDVLKNASQNRGYVVATGGGAPISPSNRDLMVRTGLVIRLTATPEEIYKRISTNNTKINQPVRPVLGQNISIKTIKDMITERESAYAFAEYIIDTSGKDTLTVANTLATLCNKWKTSHER